MDKSSGAASAAVLVRGIFRAPDFSARVPHYFLIDLLRGLSAIAVIFWHIQNFYVPVAAQAPAFGYPTSQPLYALLHPLYDNGAYAVQLFWAISGFIFAAVYGSRTATTAEFAINRFARLYPLHFITLVAMAGLQAVSIATTGTFTFSQNNDLYHFILNLLFASNWGFEKGFSFNTPIWSVSTEILIYAIFWLSLPFLFRLGMLIPLVIAGCGLLAAGRIGEPMIGFCALFFFLGAAMFVLHAALSRQPLWSSVLGGVLLLLGVADATHSKHPHMFLIVLPSICAGLLLLLSTLEPTRAGALARRMRWLGDSTYSIYLWHVPLQVAIVLALQRSGTDAAFTRSGWFLFLFIISVVVIGRVSYVSIERPLRQKIQRWAAGRRQPIRDPAISAP